jgi:hypothetical protein
MDLVQSLNSGRLRTLCDDGETVMKKTQSLEGLFKGRHFERDIIVLCVRWYLRYKLSYRDLVEMMAERGLEVAHTTIMRWVRRFLPEFEKRWNRYACRTGKGISQLSASPASTASAHRSFRKPSTVRSRRSSQPTKG